MAVTKMVWHGPRVGANVEAGFASGLAEFGLRCEAAAKKRLQPSEQDEKGRFIIGGGHGVRTGTLRRSIHTATPGYSWGGDDVEPTPGTPERGGQTAEPAHKNGKLSLEIGSGLKYALKQHQEHTDPVVHHFITNAVSEQAPKLPGILKRHVAARGGG